MGWFSGVVNTCTLTSFFIIFSMLFGLRRYSKIFKIYYKNWVILNIRIFHSHDAAIQNSIEKSLKTSAQKSMKIGPKRSSESNTLSGILFGAILGSFWIDFGPIFDPKSPIWRSKSSKIGSGRPLKAARIFIDFSRSSRRQRAAPFGVIRRQLAP